MAGTREGGLAAADRNKERDPDFYKRIGAMGGKKGRTGGFASQKRGADGLTGSERASEVGRIGGLRKKQNRDAQNVA